MIPKDCKRLVEVDFPIAEVSRHAAREKSIRHGHPSTLHLWWARRPLASSRAVLLGLLWPDPCDPLCPEEFKAKARAMLPRVQGKISAADEDLRKALLKFIAAFANWDLADNAGYLEVSRELVKAAHGEEPPLVVDPFAGGGSIPLEALRIGCEVFASDLNPVACLILKVMLEDIPQHGPKLAEDLRSVGTEIKRQAEKELAEIYPKDSDGGTPIAYLWARTVRCETPGCGAEVPIFKSAWLSKRGSKSARFFKEDAQGEGGCIALLIDRAPMGGPITLRIAKGHGSADARDGFRELQATKAKGNNPNVLCPCCQTVLSGARVMAQLAEQSGGAGVLCETSGQRKGGATLLAVISASDKGRQFRLPSNADYPAVALANQWDLIHAPGLETALINPIRPSPNARGLTAPTRYGATRFTDLFTPRQRVAIRTLIRCIGAWSKQHPHSNEVALALTLALGRSIDQCSAHVRWLSGIQAIASSFPRQAIQMTWDFVESVPIAEESANFGAAVEWVSKVIERQGAAIRVRGQVMQADAEDLPLPAECCAVLFTDPPYYDAVPYSDLANFFLVWLVDLLRPLSGRIQLFGHDGLSPTEPECIWHRGQLVSGEPKDRTFFEAKIACSFREARRLIQEHGVCCVVFAHKTTEGWEALIGGLISAGLVVHSSWPIATERSARTNAQGTASLATSVHLVCRPRPSDAGVGDWADVLRELPRRVADWMERLQREGVRGADLVFACIGPALEIFSRYAGVETAEGREVALVEYLEKVWEVVGRSALAQVLGTAEARARNGAAGAVEEDARLTALFLWTLQSTNAEIADGTSDEGEDEEPSEEEEQEEDDSPRGKAKGFTLVFDVVRRFAQPLGIELTKWEARVIETKKGVVRLLPIAERAKQLFGEDGAHAVAARLERETMLGSNPLQGMLFPELQPGATPAIRGRGRGRGKRGSVDVSDESLTAAREATTLDRIHAAMLLQAGGRTNALRALLKAEEERGPEFERLANALATLYPKGSEEKRLVEAMLLAVPR